jgi:hypothetical protein
VLPVCGADEQATDLYIQKYMQLPAAVMSLPAPQCAASFQQTAISLPRCQ